MGKTSAARILAKALNCEKGPAPVPCNQCDICQSISTGEDVDVLEIDGASNRGIDEIRQLRQNVGVRPSRARFKIYIIDEVHMLTREAFNALLKTLEEPPEHVKFIFCTTEPTKIPITILSRCQRFDFAGILTRSIRQRLRADRRGRRGRGRAGGLGGSRPPGGRLDARQPVAVGAIAGLFARPDHRGRRSRDARHGRRGAAGRAGRAPDRAQRRPRRLADLDAALSAGVDAGQLIEQLFGYFRDCMVAAVGCPSEAFLYTSPSGAGAGGRGGQAAGAGHPAGGHADPRSDPCRGCATARKAASWPNWPWCGSASWRTSTSLSEVIAQLQSAVARGVAAGRQPSRPRRRPQPRPQPRRQKKNVEPAVARLAAVPTTATVTTAGAPRRAGDRPAGTGAPRLTLTAENAVEIWNRALGAAVGHGGRSGPAVRFGSNSRANRLVIRFKPGYAVCKSACERPEQVARFEQALAEVTGQRIRVEFALAADEPGRRRRPVGAPRRRAWFRPTSGLLEVGASIRWSGGRASCSAPRPVRVDDPADPRGVRQSCSKDLPTSAHC